MPPILSLRNISKSFTDGKGRAISALTDINCEIYAGEFFVLLGPSGSGKSTLLRIMSGLEQPSGGVMRLGESVIPADMSFVFQQFALLPWLTVSQNIGLGLLAQNAPEAERKHKIRKELERFGLKAFGNSFPRELSGGMKQRVGIARAIITKPKIIFMDEPFSELDSFTAEELRKELLTLWNEKKSTIVMVTHLISEAIELADRIAVLTNRPGKIEKITVNHLPRPRVMRNTAAFAMEDSLYQLIKP